MRTEEVWTDEVTGEVKLQTDEVVLARRVDVLGTVPVV